MLPSLNFFYSVLPRNEKNRHDGLMAARTRIRGTEPRNNAHNGPLNLLASRFIHDQGSTHLSLSQQARKY
jgi:hypothetical protein